MKSHWFHLMPYKYLPEDFKDKYPSVWVDVPSELYDPVKGHELYNEYLDELEYADRVGFDGVIVNEHHANAYGLMPSPNIMLACLARRTNSEETYPSYSTAHADRVGGVRQVGAARVWGSISQGDSWFTAGHPRKVRASAHVGRARDVRSNGNKFFVGVTLHKRRVCDD